MDFSGETTLFVGQVNRVMSGKFFVQNGRGVLTNKRFIFYRYGKLKFLIFGSFINFTKGRYDFDIPLSSVARVSQGKHGVSDQVIVIETKEGETFMFSIFKYSEWEQAFTSALRKASKKARHLSK